MWVSRVLLFALDRLDTVEYFLFFEFKLAQCELAQVIFWGLVVPS